MKSESAYKVLTPNSENQTMSMLNITRPDVLLASDWLEQGSGCGKNQAIMTDSIATLLGDDLTTSYMHMTAETSTFSQVWGLDSCTWNNMPAVCQMSDLP